MKRIIITGAGGAAGVNFINSLREAKEKFYLIGTDIDKYHCVWAKTDRNYLVPYSKEKNYLEKLNEIIDLEKIDFIHPQPDSEVRVISDNREKINAKVFLPTKKTIEICQDKFLSASVWKKAGIPIAETINISSLDDLNKAKEVFGFPYWLRASIGFSSRGSCLVENNETAISWINFWKSKKVDWKFIAQEYLPGKIFAFQSVWKDGEIIVSQARERIEYIYPYLAPSGITNTPVVAKTVNREDINKIATESVLAIDKNASGIFCVDLRENKNGLPIPTEINAGRFFTTSYFFTKAGINMPCLYIKLGFNEKIEKQKQYNALPEGLYWIRHIDCPAELVREGEWNCQKI